MVVAEVAWQKLTPATRAKVSALLKRNPDYAKWLHGVPANRRDELAFLSASVWPDDIKSDPDFSDENDSPNGPRAARNVGYQDILRHKYWHYVDFAFSPDGTALEDMDPVNIQTQIHALRETLRSPVASERLKSYDLVWLIHLVGDAHQPLHSTSRFTMASPRGDRGGQGVVVCPSACGEHNPNLHVFWDAALTSVTDRAQARGAARVAALALTPANPAAVAIQDEAVWLQESFTAARNVVYANPVGTDNGPFALSEAYKANAKALASARVALAGARLALLIEQRL
jgi:hypothetical protein